MPEVTDKSRITAVDFARDLMNINGTSYHFRSCGTFVSFLCRQLPHAIRAVAVRRREINCASSCLKGQDYVRAHIVKAVCSPGVNYNDCHTDVDVLSMFGGD